MKTLATSVAVAAAALFASAAANAAVVVSFSPSSSHMNIGESVSINVSISGLGTEILSSLDINILRSTAAARFTGADFTSLANEWGGVSNTWGGIDVFNDGEVGVQGGSTLVEPPGDDDTLAAIQTDGGFLLGTLTLLGDTDGVTILSFGSDLDYQRNFVGREALSLTVDIGTACIAVGTGDCGGGQAPEPGTYGLAAVGLLAAGFARRRARKQQG